jgi:hydrogenase nickel incorporation protein HypA/HybF
VKTQAVFSCGTMLRFPSFSRLLLGIPMHELSLAEGIVGLVAQAARQNGIARVSRIVLEIGELAGVELPALESGFLAASRGTPAQGARLAIERPEGEAFCLGCGQKVAIHSLIDDCPLCAGHRLLPTGGQQMRVKEIFFA